MRLPSPQRCGRRTRTPRWVPCLWTRRTNGFPPGIEETEARWKRPDKYRRVIHAEMNAIGWAARKGISTVGATLYCTHFPCNQVGCARLIIAAGIKHIVAGQPPNGWDDDHKFAKELFDEAGVTYEILA